MIVLINNDNKSNCDVILGKYNGEENNSRRTFKEVSTEVKYHQSITRKSPLFWQNQTLLILNMTKAYEMYF